MQKGDRVICIDGAFSSRPTDPFSVDEINLPKEGETYTVRDLIQTDFGSGIRLEEIRNDRFRHGQGGLQEPVFVIERFRVI